MRDGILIINKEAGYTSSDVVAKLRGILHTRKIGHTGTLDPAAVGVLPVCIGSATKAVEYLTDHDKEYRAVLELGVTTTTQDLTGDVIEKRDVSGLTQERIREAVRSFEGDILQVPPMYSALKVNGVRLYEMARKGQTVERKARPVHIERATVDAVRLPYVDLTIVCSKGTYIRTLCEDIGKALGVGGAMAHLLRTRVGAFGLEEALTLSEVEKKAKSGTIDALIRPVEDVFPYERVKVTEPAFSRLQNGNALSAECFEREPSGSPLLVFSPDGVFFGIYEQRGESYSCQKMFQTREDGPKCRS